MKLQIIIRTILLIVQLLIVSVVDAQTPYQLASHSDLFSNDQPLEVTIEMDIKLVIKDITDRKYHPAIFVYKDPDGIDKVLDIKIRTRGQMRSQVNICKFPPLMLNFKKKKVLNTIFAGQDKLKMVTHCGSSAANERYVLQEYLIYKHFNVLTDKSFNVRLMKVNYKDIDGKRPFTEYAFLIEDKDLMAERNGMISFGKKLWHQDFSDHSSLDLMVVFQYMIGNTDWYIPNMHNIKFIAEDTLKPPFPVPYDFDYSGAIFTHYAIPHESIPVKEVRSRYFQGFCRQEGVYEKIFDLFSERKEIIYEVYKSSGLLSDKRIDIILKYFNKFYKTINNPKSVQNKLIGACRVKHKHFQY